jgi:hypothetical protein
VRVLELGIAFVGCPSLHFQRMGRERFKSQPGQPARGSRMDWWIVVCEERTLGRLREELRAMMQRVQVREMVWRLKRTVSRWRQIWNAGSYRQTLSHAVFGSWWGSASNLVLRNTLLGLLFVALLHVWVVDFDIGHVIFEND